MKALWLLLGFLLLLFAVTCEANVTTAESEAVQRRLRPRIQKEMPRVDDLIEGTFIPHRVVPKKGRSRTPKERPLYQALKAACLREYYCLWRCQPKDLCLCLCGTGQQQVNPSTKRDGLLQAAGVKPNRAA